MVFGFEFVLDGSLFVKTDISDYVSLKNQKAKIKIPESVTPIKIDAQNIQLLYAIFNPLQVYNCSINDTLIGWEYLMRQNIDIEFLLRALAVDELMVWCRGFIPAIPTIISTTRFSALINYLRRSNTGNFQHKIPKIRRQIGNRNQGILKTIIRKTNSGIISGEDIQILKGKLFSFLSELVICKDLVDLNYETGFNLQDRGPDLYLYKDGYKIEISRKLDFLNIREFNIWTKIAQEQPDKSIIRLAPPILLISLILLLTNKIEEELGQGDIIIIDITTTIEGYFLYMLESLSGTLESHNLKSALNSAIAIVESGKKAVILYSQISIPAVAISIDADWMMQSIEFVKKNCKELITRRRAKPYETLKMIGDILDRTT